jgi:hypothetical protein
MVAVPRCNCSSRPDDRDSTSPYFVCKIEKSGCESRTVDLKAGSQLTHVCLKVFSKFAELAEESVELKMTALQPNSRIM